MKAPTIIILIYWWLEPFTLTRLVAPFSPVMVFTKTVATTALNTDKCSADDLRSLPSLEMVYSADSSDGEDGDDAPLVPTTTPIKQRVHPQPPDVQRCKSQLCQACSQDHSSSSPSDTTFVPCPRVDPSEIRRLPKRWWEYDDVVHFNLMEIISGMFCHLTTTTTADHDDVDHPPIRSKDASCLLCGAESNCATANDDEDDSSVITWLTGSVDGQGNWIPHRNKPPVVNNTKAAKAPPVSTNSEDTSSMPVYLQEYRITLTTVNEDEDIDHFTPFDEQ